MEMLYWDEHPQLLIQFLDVIRNLRNVLRGIY